MKMDPCEISPSYVRSIAPYQPGKPISELAREMGLEEAGIVKLASNENPRGIGPRTRAAIEAGDPVGAALTLPEQAPLRSRNNAFGEPRINANGREFRQVRISFALIGVNSRLNCMVPAQRGRIASPAIACLDHVQ